MVRWQNRADRVRVRYSVRVRPRVEARVGEGQTCEGVVWGQRKTCEGVVWGQRKTCEGVPNMLSSILRSIIRSILVS